MRAALLGLALTTLAYPAGASLPIGERLEVPVSPACVSSPFGPRVLPGKPLAGAYHYGVDLPASLGEPVHAVASGSLIGIINRGPGGLQMIVQHPGFVGIYSHFGSVAAPFSEGKRWVAAGEKLGVVGLTGVTYGSHLYFEMVVDSRPVDPMPYLAVSLCKGEFHGGKSVTRTEDGLILPSRSYGSARVRYVSAGAIG